MFNFNLELFIWWQSRRLGTIFFVTLLYDGSLLLEKNNKTKQKQLELIDFFLKNVSLLRLSFISVSVFFRVSDVVHGFLKSVSKILKKNLYTMMLIYSNFIFFLFAFFLTLIQ